MNSSEPTAVGIHIYGGGFTLGVQRNMRVLAQLEETPFAVDTFNMNFTGIDHPILAKDWNLSKYKNVTLVYANPPCAPWSNIGSHLGKDDPRIAFTKTAVAVALILEPEFFILESVCPAWTKGREFYAAVAKKFTDIGYGVTIFMTNGILHGVPSHRERFHLIAHRYELALEEPKVDFLSIPTVGDVIGDLVSTARWTDEDPILPNHVVKRPSVEDVNVLRELEAGKKWNNVAERLIAEGVPAKKARMISGRLAGDIPCRTLVDMGCVFHPTENRMITLREGARLCGYPDDFVIAPTDNDDFLARAADLTQAVMPGMGDFLSRLCVVSREGADAKPELNIVDFRKQGRQYRPKAYRARLQEILNAR